MQKTAYEMRISDWSSDVCSSDLLTYEKDGALWMRTEAFGDEKDRVLVKADGAATYFCNDLAYHVDKLDRGWPVLMDVWGADHHGYIARVRAAIEEIGRASCRERVCQYVLSSVGAVSLKNKKQKKKT